MLFTLYRMGRFIALHIPLKASYWLAAVISSLYSYISKKDRESVKSNLKVLFPDYNEKKLDQMATRIFVNFGKYLIDFFRFSKVNKAYIDKYVKIQGLECVTKAFEGKKGVIIVSAHLGNWELGGVVFPVLGLPLVSVVLDHNDPNINRFFISQRQVSGGEVVTTRSMLRRCFSALTDNHALALIGDRDYFDNGIIVDFFGKPTSLPKGPAVLSRRCGSPIVFAFMTRNEDDSFTFRFEGPIQCACTKDEHKDLIETTEKIADVLEEVIIKYPTQWYVFRKFWEKIGLKRY